MTYNVFGGTLNLAQSISLLLLELWERSKNIPLIIMTSHEKAW